MTSGPTECVICKNQTIVGQNQGRVCYYQCPRCGSYGLLEVYRSALDQWDMSKRRKLLSYLQKPSTDPNTYVISEDTEKLLAQLSEPRLQERISALMRSAINRTTTLGQPFGGPQDRDLINASHSFSASELLHILEYLREKRLVTSSPLNSNWTLTIDGLEYFAPQGSAGFDPSQVFVAMSFGAAMTPAYANAIEPAIRAVGYVPLRIDRKEHVNRIDDEIISEIRRSRLVVADFTENKAGVYFEAGFAYGLSIPVVWSCQKEHLSKLHFDIRQFNCIDWSDEGDLLVRLGRRISANIGFGPNYTIPAQ